MSQVTTVHLISNKTMRFLIYSLLSVSLCVGAQDFTNSSPRPNWARMTARQRYEKLNFTTAAYQKEAVRLVIEEANRVAQQLNLPENLPITQSNLVEAFVSPPQMAKIGFGNITTSNYTYYVTVGDKFSYLEKHFSDVMNKDYAELKAQYLWPMSRMDTNAAFQSATQWLAAASMDVEAINRDCNVHVEALTPEGKGGAHFVPLYRVYWTEKKGNGFTPAASVEFLEPTKTLRQLRVNKTEYILRQPLQVANLDFLLSQTNAPADADLRKRLIH
jgi:hypothetical protein